VIYIFFDNLATRFSRKKKAKAEGPGTREHGTRERERAELS
jgi:hypothetical protein